MSERSPTQISAEFPFESHYIEVHGQKIHYVDEGKGNPILFVHGNPTSAYLWRNIIPHMIPQGRCIALDLIGMGKSAKPDIKYRFFDHAKYFEGFIEAMKLKNITLVIHDWGSGLGFHYAMRHEKNIKAIAFMEAMITPPKWSEFPPDFKMGFKMFRTPGVGWFMIVFMNVFLKQIMPKAIVRRLTDKEKQAYSAPYKTFRSRRPIRQWPLEIPIDGKPADMHKVLAEYSQRLQSSKLPKLLFYAHPGGLIEVKKLAWAKEHLPNLKTVDIGPGIHFLQEDNPEMIGKELAKWYKTLSK